MPIINIGRPGEIGVIKDITGHELPLNAWTDCSDITFLDGHAAQSDGYGEIFASPSFTPQYVFPIQITGISYWIYLSAAKAYIVTTAGGVTTYTDLTHATPLTGLINEWTSTLLSGIPVINAGNDSDYPAAWDLNLANNFVDLSNWQANTYCKSMRSFKNILIALNLTISGTNYPYMVKWSHPADPGSLPSSWDETDATKDAGQFDLAEGYDYVVDGLQLRDSFVVYKQYSTWAMYYTGGNEIFTVRKIFGHGILNRNCVVEHDGQHIVITPADVIIHDGNTSQTILDKHTRRYLFDDIEPDYRSRVFLFKNPALNQIFVCYPKLGSSNCDKALVWNYVDNTSSFRTLPEINHGNYGPVNESVLGELWSQDSNPWSSDLTSWSTGVSTAANNSVVMASNQTKLFLLDSTSTYDGAAAASYLERRGLSFDAPQNIKYLRRIRPRIKGTDGQTVIVKAGQCDDPYNDPTYESQTFTIGTSITCDFLVCGRYIAVRFESGTAASFQLNSYDVEVEEAGKW